MRNLYKFKLDLLLLNVGSIILFAIFYIPSIILFDFAKIDFSMNMIMLMVLWMALHEIFHGIGFGIFKGVKHKNIKYGIALEKGIFYCMCQQKISRANILTSLMFPLTFIGIITFIIGILIKSNILITLSAVNIAGAIGDIAMFITILKMPKDIEYIDFDDNSGFYIISKEDLSKLKVSGLKLESVEPWNENYEMPPRSKIKISKNSWIVLLILAVLTILYNIL